jgi:transposase InsO family protein
MNFLEDRIITRFGAPTKITTDNAKDFSSLASTNFCFKYGIVLSHSSNYHPQGNELVESSNKNLMNIIKKTMGDNKENWDSKIKYALWADCIMTKTSTWKSPFELVYGMEAKLPINLQIPVFHLMQHFKTDQEALQGRIDQLIELDKSRRNAFDQMVRNQDKIKGTLNHEARQRYLEEVDLVLMWDKRKEKPGVLKKFDGLWLGPYKIERKDGVNSFYLASLDREKLPLLVNGQLFKLYFAIDT